MLRDAVLIAGVREAEYWDMTVGEAARACDAYQERKRDTAYFAFTQAMATGLFISSMFSSKSPPTIHDIYPEFFNEDEEAEQEAKDASSAANFINFANAFNRRYEPNGNGKPESENNG